MQNRIGFIPKSYPQPDYYKNCFDAWCAVYIHPRTDEEYHIQLVLDHADRECKAVRYAEILKQTPSFRIPINCDKYLTLKSAVERMESILQ